jgi:hypothetical protein
MHDDDEASVGEGPAEPSSAPVSETSATFASHSDHASSPPPIFHRLAYRGVVATWPIEWRERWGQRANALEDSGLSWRDAETQAFVEIWNELRHRDSEKPGEPQVPASAELTASPQLN